MRRLVLIAAAGAMAAGAAYAAMQGGGRAAPADFEGLPHAQPEAVFPNTDDGRPIMQLGMGGSGPLNLEQPFLNAIKLNQARWTAEGGGEKIEFPALLEEGAIDPETNYPRAMPSNGAKLIGGVFRYGANTGRKKDFAGTWVIDWEGDADIRLGYTQPSSRKTRANRIEAMYAVDKGWNRIEVTDLGEDPFRNLRVYRAEHEALLNSGKLLNPQFRDYAGRYKILRTMDLQAANVTWARTAAHFNEPSAPFWGRASDAHQAQRRAFPIRPLFDIAMETDTALWMNVPAYIGAPDSFDALAGDWKAVRAFAEAHALEIRDSEEWDRVAALYVEKLIESGYPEDRLLYVELANEIWNWAPGFGEKTGYFQSLGKGFGLAGTKERAGYGYMLANFTVAFEKALAESGRAQAWGPVMGSWTGSTKATEHALDGFKTYFEERGVDPEPWLSMVGVSTTSYFSGGIRFKKNGSGFIKATSEEDYRRQFLARIKADPEGLMDEVAEWTINGPDNVGATLPWVVKMRAQHQAMAEKYGAFFLGDYEGHDHDITPRKFNDPAFVNWVENYRNGPHGERVARAWVEALQAQNPEAVIANFGSISEGDPEGDSPKDTRLENPWNDGYYGEDTGLRRALEDYLRPPLD